MEAGTPLGHLLEGGVEISFVAPVRVVFLGWLAREGERVAPGSPLAVLVSLEGEV